MSTQTQSIEIDGLNCPNCAAKVERSVDSLSGVRNVRVRFETNDATLEYDPAEISLERIAYTVENTGCDSSLFTIAVDGHRIEGNRQAAADGGDGSRDDCCDGEETANRTDRAPF